MEVSDPLVILDRIVDRLRPSEEPERPIDDIDRLLPEFRVVTVRRYRSAVRLGTYPVRPGDDGDVRVGDRIYRGPDGEIVRATLREICFRKDVPLPRWLRPPATHTSTAGAIALLFGLLALVLCVVPLLGILAFPLGIVAVVAALVGLRRIGRFNLAGRGLAFAGLLTGGIALLIATSTLVVFLLGFRGPAWQGDWNEVRELFRTQPR